MCLCALSSIVTCFSKADTASWIAVMPVMWRVGTSIHHDTAASVLIISLILTLTLLHVRHVSDIVCAQVIVITVYNHITLECPLHLFD